MHNRWRTESMCDYLRTDAHGQGAYLPMHYTPTLMNNSGPTASMHAGHMRVGRMVKLHIATYQRLRVGPKYAGRVLFMEVQELTEMPERVENFYVCAKHAETSRRYVAVENMCTLLADVDDRYDDPNIVNLVPLTHAFPVSWVNE
jgi:hypothetical protein